MSYLSKCKYTEEYTPEHTYTFTGPCIVTGELYSVTVPADRLWVYNRGWSIQEAFPCLSPEDREFIKTGISPKAWEQDPRGPSDGEKKYKELASSWELWVEYVDPGNEMDEDEFNELSVEEKVKILTDAFGEEEP